MNDIGLFSIDNRIDLKLNSKQDLASDDGLETAIIISLFSDQRISIEELPLQERYRKGWWGDLVSDVDKDQIGSKIWIYARLKKTPETRLKIENAARQSLQWLIEDGLAKSVTVAGEYILDGKLALSIQIFRSNGVNEKYSVIWDQQSIRRD